GSGSDTDRDGLRRSGRVEASEGGRWIRVRAGSRELCGLWHAWRSRSRGSSGCGAPGGRYRGPGDRAGSREGMMPTRVLIVEDSPTQAEALRALLEEAGYTVVAATTGEDALRRLEAEVFDVVVSDVMMPGSVDGYELCRRLKAGAGRDIPFM